jgi:SAM-dependent methyltransferase
MIGRLLENPAIYSATQALWYRSGEQQRYVRDWIHPRPGDRILDIGCGPASILDLLPEVHYIGYDPNPRYISAAQTRFGTRGRFHSGYLTEIPPAECGTFDIVLANGVLHHLSDAEARDILRLAGEALRPEGHLVTRDGCREESQNKLARFLLNSDRGYFVRTQTAYEALFRPAFDVVRAEIRRDVLRLPYSLLHLEAKKAERR